MDPLGDTVIFVLPPQPDGTPTKTFIVPDAEVFAQDPVVVIV